MLHFFFCRPSGCLVHRKIQPYRPKWRSPEGAMVRPTKQVRGRRDDTGGWLNSLSVQAPTPRGARYRATFPQHTGDGTRIPRHLAHQLRKTALRLQYNAGLCCKRGIATLSALRACESSEYCQSRGGEEEVTKKQYFSLGETVLKQ